MDLHATIKLSAGVLTGARNIFPAIHSTFLDPHPYMPERNKKNPSKEIRWVNLDGNN